jgi:hypothetical protein
MGDHGDMQILAVQGWIQGGGGGICPPIFLKNIDFSCSCLRLLPKITPSLGYIFTPRPSYFKVGDPPLQCISHPEEVRASSVTVHKALK